MTKRPRTPRPRFIAGAVCPACGAMDRLQVIASGDDRVRRCVACGHEDRLEAVTSRPPKSRLDGGLKRPADPESRPVRIVGTDKARPPADGSEPDEGA
ncbi:MAG: YheV family putative metal-binding protein [Pseudomonadales bacterium]|jgi:uncharacterized metal-binding protein (TIGR02443 family)